MNGHDAIGRDLLAARAAYRKHLNRPERKDGEFPMNPRPYPYTRRAAWTMAIHALAENRRLDPSQETMVREVYEKVRDSEQVPPQVAEYLGQPPPGRGRPRKMTQAAKERRVRHIVWLLYGYYRQQQNAKPFEKAAINAGALMGMEIDNVDRIWKKRGAGCWYELITP